MADYEHHAGRHKKDDWQTSIEGAANVGYRSGTQKAKLSEAFRNAFPDDLTDEEAAIEAGVSLSSEYSKRCGELREDGVIEVVYVEKDVPLTRPGRSGINRIVSRWRVRPRKRLVIIRRSS